MSYFKHKMRGKNPAMIAGMVVLGIIGITGLFILFGFIIMWLWNWLMPELFGLTTLTFWQGVGLFLLSKILFGGFGGGSNKSKNQNNGKCRKRKNHHPDSSKWQHYNKFWDEEGELAYEEYVERMKINSDNQSSETKNDLE